MLNLRILITSGGTNVPIDPVRHIANKSTGRFGADIARAALTAGAEVFYLVSNHGRTPFTKTIDFNQPSNIEVALGLLNELKRFAQEHRGRYHEYRYNMFNDYYAALKSLIDKENPDVIILAAAASDYLATNVANNKIRTQDALNIQLEAAPKAIQMVKTWAPTSILVGFKLLVNGTEVELVEAAKVGMSQHHADFVVANNFSSIQRGAHEILLVEPDGSYEKYSKNLGQVVIDRVLQIKGGIN